MKTNFPDVGLVYDDALDGYVKSAEFTPHDYVYFNNLRLEIVANQPKYYAEAQLFSGVDLPKENTVFFNQDSIHPLILKIDPNRSAIWIDYRARTRKGTNNLADLFFDIYMTMGKSFIDSSIEAYSVALIGLYNFLRVMPPMKLVQGWPAHIANECLRSAYQPEITIDYNQDIVRNPDATAGQVTQFGAIGCISCKYLIDYKPNIIT